MVRAIINIVLGGALMAGGLSGKVTLIFTNSSLALTVVGAGAVALGTYQIIREMKRRKQE